MLTYSFRMMSDRQNESKAYSACKTPPASRKILMEDRSLLGANIDSSAKRLSEHVSQRPRSTMPESCVILWLDSDINQSDEDYQYALVQLSHLAQSIHIFSHVDECIDFITEMGDEKVFLIISDDIGYRIVSLIHDIIQLDSIYVISANEPFDERWIDASGKIRGTFNHIALVCDLIKRNLRWSDMSCTTLDTFISSTESLEPSMLDELDRSFMYSLLLKEIFLDIEEDSQTKQELVEFWRHQYGANTAMLKRIDEFEHNYDRQCSIWWYTKEPFIYSMVNRALRELEIDILMKMKFIIRDLHRQIEQLHTESTDEQQTLTVYRGQCIRNVDFDKIFQRKGGLLSFNNFLSTSTDREISLLFSASSEHNSDLTAVLFRIDLDRSTTGYPYAPVQDISHHETENEVLFSMNTIFRIGDVRNIEDRLFEINLTSTNDDDPQLHNLMDHIREEIGGGTGWHRLGHMMIRLGEFDKAEEVYETLLHSAQSRNQTEIAHLYHQLGFIKKEKGDLNTARTYFQKTLDIQQQCLTSDDPALALTYHRIGSIHFAMNEYQTALSLYQKALSIQKFSLPAYHSDIAITYSYIGDVYQSTEDYSAALSFYRMALKTQEKSLPPNDPSLAETHNCIGLVHKQMGDYQTALSSYEKALHIEETFLPINHPSLGSTFNNIADLHLVMGRCSTALTLYEKALKIQQKSYSNDHISLATTYRRIGGVYETIGDPSSAVIFYQKALEIQRKNLPLGHSEFAISYASLGSIYNTMGDYPAALSYYQTALEIEEKTALLNYSQLATIYNNLGYVYQSMEDYSTALSYYHRTLHARQQVSPLNYPALAATYNNLGLTHDLMKDYANALALYQKALDIKQSCYPPDHLSLATTYNNIGDVYRSIGAHSTALEYLQKTLEIEQKALPDNHPDLAVTYNNIAKVFIDLREYNSAIEYTERAIKIARHALGPMHPDVKLFEDNLNKILEKH